MNNNTLNYKLLGSNNINLPAVHFTDAEFNSFQITAVEHV